jgi:predicted ribosomally synthesized peptide with nif11-like leader
MASENLGQFYEMIAQDQELQEKLKATMGSETFVKLVVNLGEEKGYSFTTQEVERAIIEAKEKKDTETLWQELNERELEVVVGGGEPLLAKRSTKIRRCAYPGNGVRSVEVCIG